MHRGEDNGALVCSSFQPILSAAGLRITESGFCSYPWFDLAPVLALCSTIKGDRLRLSFDCDDWRFNLRKSITEPMVTLNLAARGNVGGFQQRIAALSTVIVG